MQTTPAAPAASLPEGPQPQAPVECTPGPAKFHAKSTPSKRYTRRKDVVNARTKAVDGSGVRVLIMQAIFSMVCRDKASYAAAHVPKLRAVTAFDAWAAEDGVRRRIRRKEKSEHDLKRIPPTPDEIHLIHSLHLAAPASLAQEGSAARASSAEVAAPAMLAQSQTSVSTMEVMHVQERNVHNKIFGGTLMRMALELATTCAYNVCPVSRCFYAWVMSSFWRR